MTDRELCRKCIHSCFSSPTYFQYCNYLDDTGNRRPHDGDNCFGFEAWDGKKKRRRRMPGKRPGRTKSSTLNENSVQKAAKTDTDVQKAAQIQQAALIQQAVSVIRRERDKDVRAAAQRIRNNRNKMFDEMTMWAQHMGDNVNRIV